MFDGDFADFEAVANGRNIRDYKGRCHALALQVAYCGNRLHNLIARLRDHSGDEVYKQRFIVAARLKAIIQKIIIDPSKMWIYKGDEAEVLDLSNFEVCFHNGVSRIVHPDPGKPLKFVRQVYGTGGQLDIIDPDGRRYRMDDGY